MGENTYGRKGKTNGAGNHRGKYINHKILKKVIDGCCNFSHRYGCIFGSRF